MDNDDGGKCQEEPEKMFLQCYDPKLCGALFGGTVLKLLQEGQHPLTGQRAPPISGGT